MIKEFIAKAPGIIQKPIRKLYGAVPYERWQGKKFYETYRFLEHSQWWSKEKLEDYQFRELTKLLNHAYQNVPYYQKVFNERGIKPEDIRSFADLTRLPYLTKDIVIKNREHLIALNYPSRALRYLTTGGTTGVPMMFAEDRRIATAREWAFITSLWRSVGYDIRKKNRSVILRGLIPIGNFYEYRGLQLVLSSYLMVRENMGEYLKRIRHFRPDFIQAYPSAISQLAEYIFENDIKLKIPNLKAIFCSSETVYDFQRVKIEKAFQTRLYSFYGLTEKCCLAGECEHHSEYHLVPEYGYTELVNSAGGPATRDGELGEIVCTGFNNYAMPFIRYKTGDIAVNSTAKCTCGREYPRIKRVQGRAQEFLVDKTGSLITFTCSDDVLWPIHGKLRAYQYLQREPGKVVLNLEGDGPLDALDVENVRREFYQWYPRFEVSVNRVDQIDRTPAGKFKFLVQHLPVRFGAESVVNE